MPPDVCQIIISPPMRAASQRKQALATFERFHPTKKTRKRAGLSKLAVLVNLNDIKHTKAPNIICTGKFDLLKYEMKTISGKKAKK